MKNFFALVFILLACQACASSSGSTIGNGLVSNETEIRKEIRELCEKKDGKIEKKSGAAICILKDKKELTLQNLEAELEKSKK